MKTTQHLVILILLGLLLESLTFNVSGNTLNSNAGPPMEIAIAGLSHDHVHGILRQLDRADFQVVGIFETNLELAKKYSIRYGFTLDLVYTSLDKMLDEVKPEAVLGFGSTFEHLALVVASAKRGIHVMVEKPMAVNMDHALKMEVLIKKHDIKFLVNYETTWYATHHRIKELVDADSIGPLRKIVVHDGHEGPREIGCSEEFLSWLTDPILNGGGAVTDFGCYGANLITWLMQGKKPMQVLASLQQIKPDVYPKVDDEANIIVTYPDAVGMIQASWNWPFGRKDMEVYGKKGWLIADNKEDLRMRFPKEKMVQSQKIVASWMPYDDPFKYFIGVIRGEIKMTPFDLSSLENNMMVVQILDAAKESARTNTAIEIR